MRQRPHSRGSPASSRSSSVSSAPDTPAPSAAKSVAFIPLSPQSSRTLRSLHESHVKGQSDDNAREPSPSGTDGQAVRPRRPNFTRRRSDSDPSSNRPMVQRRKHRGDLSPVSDEDVEVLPDRFDPAGRPIDPNSPQRLHSRRGDFEYRSRDGNGMQVQGAWGVHGTDPEMVNRMAQGFGDLLQGRHGWMGILGNVLTSLPGPSGAGHEGRAAIEAERGYDSDDEDKRRRRRHRHRRDDDY